MPRIPHYLRHTVAWAFPVCQVDTLEIAFFRCFQHRFKLHHFSCVTSFSSMAGALFIAFPIVFCLSLVFSLSKLKRSSPRSQPSSLFDSPSQLPGSSLTIYVSDATFEAGVHTWVSRRLYQLLPFGWMPTPSPCVTGSGFHTGWPSPIPPETSHPLASCRLH